MMRWFANLTVRRRLVSIPDYLNGTTPDTKGFITKRCIISKRLEGKIAIVTGANTGIGFHTAGELARRGAIVIMACRNRNRAEAAKAKLLSMYGHSNVNWIKMDVADPCVVESLKPIHAYQLIVEHLDLASLESVRQFAVKVAQMYPKIDFLINNAGLASDIYSTTRDGFEQTIGVNHLGHFLLTELLLPTLRAAAPSRIIIVSSVAHYCGRLYRPDLQMTAENYKEISAYSSSKLANAMHAVELSHRLEGTNVAVVFLHPGAVKTEILKDFKSVPVRVFHTVFRPLFVKAWVGAQTTLYTALADNLTSGGYYSNCTLKTPNKLVNNETERQWLWEKSYELVGLTSNYPTNIPRLF
ncbi:Retinol dehydrogenase 12 [Fasciola hepatica]|uniref:Retinol dehydrogenase 12 n=1 Tax=Fasciola hepatica TaxID=6192 RepID=A0A4E0RTU5_FASHE|nr:Retinol dehydrogenase 12 [Fasciola hepatica]